MQAPHAPCSGPLCSQPSQCQQPHALEATAEEGRPGEKKLQLRRKARTAFMFPRSEGSGSESGSVVRVRVRVRVKVRVKVRARARARVRVE